MLWTISCKFLCEKYVAERILSPFLFRHQGCLVLLGCYGFHCWGPWGSSCSPDGLQRTWFMLFADLPSWPLATPGPCELPAWHLVVIIVKPLCPLLHLIAQIGAMMGSQQLSTSLLNPSNAEAFFVWSMRTQTSMKTILSPVMLVFIG